MKTFVAIILFAAIIAATSTLSVISSPLRGSSEVSYESVLRKLATGSTCDQTSLAKTMDTCGFTQFQQDQDQNKLTTSVCSGACKAGFADVIKICGENSAQAQSLKISMEQLADACSKNGYANNDFKTSAGVSAFVFHGASFILAAAFATTIMLL